MKNSILVMMLLFVALSSQAQEQKNKNAKHNIEVNGNCDMCKKRIEKAAFSVKGVKSADWHIDDHILHLIIDPFIVKNYFEHSGIIMNYF